MRDICPACGSRTAFQSFKDNSYCHKCHYNERKKESLLDSVTISGPGTYHGKFLDEIPKKVLFMLAKYYLNDLELIKKYNIKYCPNLIYKGKEWGERIVFPKYHIDDSILFFEAKTTGGNKVKWISYPNKNVPYKASEAESKAIVITEDIISAIRVNEVFPAMALRGLKMSDYTLAELVKTKEKVVLWLDGDIPGQKAARQLKDRIGMYIPVEVIQTDKDPKMYSNKEIREWMRLSSSLCLEQMS